MLNRVEFDAERCKGCGLCIEACPQNIISFTDETNEQGYRVAGVKNQDECTSCGLCALMCPDLVIRVVRPKKEAV